MSQTITITIDATKVAADLTDFPVFVNLVDMPAEFWATVSNGGGDIRVYKADGVTELAREPVSCDTSLETGELHFLADFLSSTVDTVFKIVVDGVSSDYAVTATYGRNAVWGDYAFVSHDGGPTDSTGNNANNANLTDSATAKIGGDASKYVRANNDYVRYPTNSVYDFGTGELSLSAWVKPNSTGVFGGVIVRSNNDHGFFLTVSSANKINTQFNGPGVYNSLNGATSFTSGTWLYAVGTRRSSAIDIYYNGSNDGTRATNNYNVTTTQPLVSGAYRSTSLSANMLNADLDETRIRGSALSADWITTEYNNQSSPATFYTAIAETGGTGTDYELACETGSFTATGGDASIAVGYHIAAEAGTFTIIGGAATPSVGYAIAANTGSFSLNGGSTTISRGITVDLATGTFSLTGGDATISRGTSIALATGSFALSGNPAALIYGAGVSLGTGAFTLAGNPTAIARATALALDTGTFQLDAQNADLRVSYTLDGQTGVFTLSGTPTELVAALGLSLEGGSYILTGFDVEIVAGSLVNPFCPAPNPFSPAAKPFTNSASPFRSFPRRPCS